MSLDKTIRESLDGGEKYLIIHANDLEEGIDYAVQMKIAHIQVRGILGRENSDVKIDFKAFEKISGQLKILSLSTIENVINTEGIYFLENLEKLYLDKQKFKIDVSKFPKIEHLGSEYWKGLINLNSTQTLQSLVLSKLPNVNLNELSELQRLQIVHIYSSKIETLAGIERLPIKELSLVRNSILEDIQAIKELKSLQRLLIEKCKKITDFDFINSLKEKIDVKFIQ
jgi:internalin A